LSHNDLRRTFASWLKQKGCDSQLVGHLMGHTGGAMVDKVYGRLDPAQFRNAVNKL
jgi:integrase